MNISKDKKIFYSTLIVVFVLLLSIGIPTLGKFRKRGASSSNVWTGAVAVNYRNGTGTSDDPYIISNGDELAFFSSQLENNNYEGRYFKITNNILLNEGEFSYVNGNIEYTIGSNTYYLDNNNYYYDNVSLNGSPIGSVNVLPSLDGFRGTLTGEAHVIYGYYNTESLFTDLKGSVNSLYLENALVNTNKNSGIFADTITSGDLTNIIVDGYLVSGNYTPGVDPIDYLEYLSDYSELNEIVLGGVSAYTNDATLINCVSKVNINGGFISGGLVGYSEDSSIINSYSTGTVNSYLANTIGVFKGTGTVDKVYNSGVINGGLLGYVISSNLEISNSFVATDNYLVVDTIDSNITSTNNYYITQGKGDNIDSTLATLNDLKDKNYLTSYTEFVDANNLKTNPLNVWVFDDNYPVLFFDDIVNTYAELNINTYMWNTYNKNLDIFRFTNNITFMISDVDNVHTTSKYYYVTDNRTALSKSALENVEWTPYTDVVVLNNEGFYVVYVKLVDNNSNISYINSDILVLDNSGSDVTITVDNNSWTSVTSGEQIIDHNFNINVTAVDILSGVKSVEYYLSNSVVDDLDTITWTSYSGPITINSFGEYILYAKVVDNCNFVSYASTPKFIYEGYVVSNTKPINFNDGTSITKKSSIMFDVNYTNNRTLNITHDLVSSVNLPVNTKITMIDKTNNKTYEYVVSEATNRIAFTSFKEVGMLANVYYTEGSVTNEAFTFIIDFKNCTIENNINNINIYVEGKENDSVVRPVVTKQAFNILTNNNLSLTHTISTNYNGSITYNSDSSTTVAINNTISLNGAYDTTFANKKTGLAIKVVDSDGNVVNKNNLKNIIFKIGDNKYAPENDNIIRINLNTNTTSVVNLNITTYDGNLLLDEGTYYIEIYGYASHNGIYYSNEELTDPITIPLNVLARSENNNYNYRFNVLLDNESRIVDKGGVIDYTFLVLQDGIRNPNIKVSMYKKDRLTAYNQDYTLIDMQDYTNAQLDEYIEGVYYLTRNALSYSRSGRYNVYNYSLNTATLDKTGYKFVFDLYDGSIKVESISKYIIVR